MNRIAVIDIGSNSVRYMEAVTDGAAVTSLGKTLCTTRLAEGQAADRALQPEPMRRTAEAVLAFADRAKKSEIPVYAYATSALREASNRDAFLSLLGGFPVTILSGKEEAAMAYRGAAGGEGTLLDIGGGSFQLCTAANAFSAPIGCVRFADRMPEGTPRQLLAFLEPWLDLYLPAKNPVELPVTGVGGTITTLGALLLGQTRYDGAALKNASITPAILETLLETLYAMGEKRKEHPLLHKRHSVILQGGTILRALMARLDIPSVTPSDRDGMEGFAEAVLLEKNV